MMWLLGLSGGGGNYRIQAAIFLLIGLEDPKDGY